jgi:hypothetical protein
VFWIGSFFNPRSPGSATRNPEVAMQHPLTDPGSKLPAGG